VNSPGSSPGGCGHGKRSRRVDVRGQVVAQTADTYGMRVARSSPASHRSVSGEVTGAFRAMLVALAGMVALTLGLLFWLVNISDPGVSRLARVVASVEDAHVGLVDAETGLRGYVATGEDSFLSPYARGLASVTAADTALQRAQLGGHLSDDLLSFRLAQQAWVDGWASAAVRPETRLGMLDASGRADPAKTTAFLVQGRTLMDTYRATEKKLIADARAAVGEDRTDRRIALVSFCCLLIVLAAVTMASALRRRSALRARVVGPVTAMLHTVRAVAAGDFRPPATVDGTADLVSLRDGLADMTAALSEQRALANARELAAARNAQRLHHVLAFAREVSGTLSLRYVLEALSTAATTLTGAAAVRIWLASDDDVHLHLASDTGTGRKGRLAPEVRELGVGTVGRAALQARVCRSSDTDAGVNEGTGAEVIAMQLTVGARVVGVLELIGAQPDELDDALGLVETVTGHAATAMEAARLYQQAQTASVSDALTGLANRRRLDEDLLLEVERAVRYSRPVSLIMVDLDHFKALNDTFGHPRGDIVLQQVAQTLTDTVRSCDTVYRYGGEEIAIIVRDTDLAGADALAERLREAVELRFNRDDGPILTLSAGVAAVPEHAATPAGLLAAADAALYASKDGGRNRTTVAVS
jgi:diguanylate cyclase (GGDEF)-like protein